MRPSCAQKTEVRFYEIVCHNHHKCAALDHIELPIYRSVPALL